MGQVNKRWQHYQEVMRDMPVLTNPRHERFAAIIAQGLLNERWSQGRAYQQAGYFAKDAGKSGGSAEAAASRLLKKVQPILDRVREIQGQAAKRTKITVATIVDELEEARDVAKGQSQGAAMVAATSAKAKILGLSVDRIEQGKPGDFSASDTTAMVADQLLKQAGIGEEHISGDMRAMALDALARFNAELAAIAQSCATQAS